MSGFTRDTKRYGDRLVYEALGSKWRRYHDTHCRCGLNWVTEHAEPAGFTVVRSDTGWVALIGPGQTEDVDESALTTDALWEAVTGKPGLGWPESVRVIDRGEASSAIPQRPVPSAAAKQRERRPAAEPWPATDKQVKYLTTLVGKVGRERFDTAFNVVVHGTEIAPRGADERTGQALRRLTRAAARKLITALVGP
ncbi:hypothetical protein SAMN05421874_107294 [Nonomuraea maritima]|uniref:Uncharacterized protein n=1 Tax=Nonomuraea maritima TaxID=683260 RepID=A0A1G9BV16_9ACTN|nr:hypothetical protein [Nonomuraea maritima]SDK42994.1 hypothetical protein SAMN05421874_107294 [Nonomuraea maritima]